MLCGVLLAAIFTYVFAIPANSNYWRWEIWKRGGAAWTVDKDGYFGWKWLVEPKVDSPLEKRATVPVSAENIRTEKL
jgi:hypothetical protein